MKRTMSVVAVAGLLALPVAAGAQQPEGGRGWGGGWGDHSTDCPQPKIRNEKITEDEARILAQAYGNKNLPGYKVERPDGYTGGYNTMCYQMTNNGAYQILYSVEYSIDLTTPKGDRRNVRVDQFGNVTPFGGPFGVAGAHRPAPRDGADGPAGAQGPMGQTGAQGLAGAAGARGMTGAVQQWASFKDFQFDTDKSDIRSNEMSKITEIAAYMRQNLSATVGIDGHADPRGTDQ